jgi:subtilisin
MKKVLVFPAIAIVLIPMVLATPANSRAPYWVLSDNQALRNVVEVRHDFGSYFSAWLTPAQVRILEVLGVETEPVEVWYITSPPEGAGKPVCGDGEAHPSEQCGEPGLPECPEGYTCVDCKCVSEEEVVVCYPDNQYPWGIVKVKGGSGGTGVDVAVLDTGVMVDHQDLANRIVDCKDFTKGPKPKDRCNDGHGHGTHVSGTVLAWGDWDGSGTVDPGEGIVGVAPQANLMAMKVCTDEGWCWTDDIAAGIDYAATHGAEVISMSFGGDRQSKYIKEAIDRNPGVLYVAAAGNDRQPDPSADNPTIDYPAAYVKVIAVAAFDVSDAMWTFSSTGVNDGDWIIEEKEIEFAAPGVSIESTWNDGCYKYMSGTSMSTPHVSGLAAKYWQGSALATRGYLQELAYNYTTQVFDYGQPGDDIEAGFGLPVAL